MPSKVKAGLLDLAELLTLAAYAGKRDEERYDTSGRKAGKPEDIRLESNSVEARMWDERGDAVEIGYKR